MVSVLFHTTLIRDQNGLGFSIAGGEGSPPFKDNNDVRTISIKFLSFNVKALKLLHIIGVHRQYLSRE